MSANLDDLLNTSLDNIDDLPSTSAWPVGAHVAKVKIELNQKDPKKPLVIARAELISTEEQADPDAPAAKPGDEYSWIYNLIKKDGGRNDYGLEQIKTYFGNPLIESGDLTSDAKVMDIINAYKDGQELLLTTGQKPYNNEMQMTIKSVAKV